MLAQNFKSATDLEISDREHSALITVLGMLERGDLTNDNGFNMGSMGVGCGSPACIGGWVARLIRLNEFLYMGGIHPVGLNDLYWNDSGCNYDSTDQAAVALRSYLTTGDARWDLAVAS